MDDYPKTQPEFDARFATDDACVNYMFRLRWPKGFTCPRCRHDKGWSTGRALIVCGACGYQASITAGTIFQDTHKPLTLWFKTLWWMTGQKTGTSALGLQRVLGLGSYRTAWTWLHKLRRAMVRPGRDRLSGRIEVDESYVGGPEEGLRGRQIEKKSLIVIAAQEEGRGTGRIRMRRIPDASCASLHSFIRDVIEPGSTVHTDGWEGYTGLEAQGYPHQVTILKQRTNAASESLPRVHRVAALLKTWLQGTHQGAVSPEHLDYYLDEFTFRFNRRTSRHRGLLFYRLLQQAAAVEPVPYHSLIKHARGPKPKNHDR